jgi:hypothetical protein
MGRKRTDDSLNWRILGSVSILGNVGRRCLDNNEINVDRIDTAVSSNTKALDGTAVRLLDCETLNVKARQTWRKLFRNMALLR